MECKVIVENWCDYIGIYQIPLVGSDCYVFSFCAFTESTENARDMPTCSLPDHPLLYLYWAWFLRGFGWYSRDTTSGAAACADISAGPALTSWWYPWQRPAASQPSKQDNLFFITKITYIFLYKAADGLYVFGGRGRTFIFILNFFWQTPTFKSPGKYGPLVISADLTHKSEWGLYWDLWCDT